MNSQNTLGEWSDHSDRMWEDARQFLDRLGRKQEIIDDNGYQSIIVAAASESLGTRLAFVETREKESRSGYWDVTHTLRVIQGDKVLVAWELPTYNPFFGCEIGLLEWYGDDIAVVYREKHRTLLALFNTWTSECTRLLPITDDWRADSSTLYFLSNEPLLIETCEIPSMTLGIPIPTSLAASARRFASKPNVSIEDYVNRVAVLLFGRNPPQPLADLLIGASAYRFWDRWPVSASSYRFQQRWNSPFWMPFYWKDALGGSEFERFVEVLNDLKSKTFIEETTGDFQFTMAAEHVCRAATLWGEACQAGELPKGQWCHFWVEWSQKGFRRSLNLFPSGFCEAYKQILQVRMTQ